MIFNQKYEIYGGNYPNEPKIKVFDQNVTIVGPPFKEVTNGLQTLLELIENKFPGVLLYAYFKKLTFDLVITVITVILWFGNLMVS